MGRYHDILGVAEGATEKEIKSAYRAKAKTCHPDTNQNDPEAEQKFRELSEAYEGLLNGHSGDATTGGYDGFDDDDIWESFTKRASHNVRTMIRHNIEVPIDVLVNGGEITVGIGVPKIHSAGFIIGHTTIPVDVTIEPNTKIATQIRVNADGTDVVLVVYAAPTDGFHPNGLNLFYKLQVDALKAMVDPIHEIDVPTGKTYRFDITQNREDLGAGDLIRLEKCGLEAINGEKGDLYINVMTRLRTLSDENKKILKDAIDSFEK